LAPSRDDLRELLGIGLSAETLRTVSEKHGRPMASWQPQDPASTAAFQAVSEEVECTVDAGTVHTLEAGWKDLKIAVLQKRPLAEPAPAAQGDQHILPEATARLCWGAEAPAQQFRRRWRGWLRRVGVWQAAEVHGLADGAAWIWKSVQRVLTGSLQTLAIYPALGQGALAGQALYGEGSEAAAAFRERGRDASLAEGWSGLCRLVAEEYAQGDTPPRRAALERLVGSFVKHTTRLADAGRLQSGRAIGSGVVEGQAKTLGVRLQARGARWKWSNVCGRTALVCVRSSDPWQAYWAQAASIPQK
jgi:hypothetical protein